MQRVLVLSPYHGSYLATELQQRIRHWHVEASDSPHDVLEMLEKFPVSFNFIFVQLAALPRTPDLLALMLAIRLHRNCQHTRFVTLLPWQCPTSQFRAALAVGADFIHPAPQSAEDWVPLLLRFFERLLHLAPRQTPVTKHQF